MKIVELIRLEDSKAGTFGVLKINKSVFCATLEPPDNMNAQNISSIPVKQYLCNKRISKKYGETFEVKNVPGRSDILFHAGNVVDNTKGCILLGQYFGKLRGNRAVLNSGFTFKKFMSIMKGQNRFHLTITEKF